MRSNQKETNAHYTLFPSPHKRGRLVTTLLLALLCFAVILSALIKSDDFLSNTAIASSPSSGTLTTISGPLTYTGGPFVVANASAQANGTPICNAALPCDDYTLTISVPPGTDTTKRVKIKVEWPVSAADFDVYILQGSTVVATSASSSDPEVAILPAVSGVYTIRTVPFTPAGQSYTGTVILEDIPPLPPAPPPGIAPRYQSYPPAPADLAGADSAGEPSIGIDWNIKCAATTTGCENLHPNAQFPKRNTGGVAFFTANLNEFRVTFDDCSSPARNLWEDKTNSTEGVTSLDPIGFVDSQIGRVFQSQLAGASSILSFSDDDGQTWTQSQGSGQPAGVDHQTVGGGPYNNSSTPPPPPHPLYANQVYYASQDVGTAFAARSDDGGLTFGPGVAMWNITQCGGLHGHIKVGPDGTVYVPNKGCGGAQGVAVSTDNGLTWTVRTVPNSTPGDTDPSVAIGADNTVYFGYQNGDGHPHMASSTNKGVSWIDRDVGQGFIKNTVFPEAAAGDGDRAAFGFLGTPTGGNYQDTNNFRGVWHFYIATTFDRGNTYFLVDATPHDPVQIGSICTGGTTCGGDRNLLDFNDLQVDKEGRVMAAYADGCVAPACTESTADGNPPYNSSRSALSSIIRQSGGRRLFAAFDPTEPAAPAAPRVDSVVRIPTQDVLVDWSEPDNGGSLLTNYKVYRKEGAAGTYTVLATLGINKTDYVDATADNPAIQYFYKVTAVNAIGEGSNCGEFPVGQSNVADKCSLPGSPPILTDPAGDIIVPAGQTSNAGWDARSLSIAEPFAFAPNKLVFTLKMESLATVPPNTRWPVTFTSPDNINYTVRMTNVATDGATTAPIFQMGPTAGPFVPADAASTFSADGTITIMVPTSGIGNPQPGQSISGFLVRIAFNAVAGTVTPDKMPDSLAPSGSYTLIGNAACAPNTAPVAALSAAPTSGPAPLTVNFDGSGSHDPDAGDSIASYTFDFGDGSAVVTQASPTIAHTYNSAGDYHATLKVTDSRGKPSNNVAEKVIEVSAATPSPSPSPSPLPSTIQFSMPGSSVTEGCSPAAITVVRTGAISTTATVDYSSADGSAQQHADYEFAAGRLTFNPGDTTQTINLLINEDSYAEGTEAFTVSLSNPTGGALLGPVSSTTVSISDNDTSTSTTTNVIDDASMFVCEHYHDFLNRQGDPQGQDFWTNEITRCAGDDACVRRQRIGVSAAFFIEQEFQQTGFYVYRIIKSALGRRPAYAEFMSDRSRLASGSNLDTEKVAYTLEFVQRGEFTGKYSASLNGPGFVDALIQNVLNNSAVDLTPRRSELITEYNNGGNQTDSRARVLRKLIEYDEFKNAEFNSAFVLAQYFSYLRREPDDSGYNFWLNVLNTQPNNFRGMVCAFITSAEYQDRFGAVRTHSNAECSGSP